ncbi:hypothetical protein ACFV14_00685 [Streptomyces zaomyceticus]|uniref:hypothetical protein n=1 Tax=Streptomyces zaomyceticus TaxID=68286 RepID=UPI0036A46C0D
MPAPPRLPAAPCGFTCASPSERGRDRLPLAVGAGCADLRLAGAIGPLPGRVITRDADGFREPDVSSARDFPAPYGRWLDRPVDGRDGRAPEPVFSAPRRPLSRGPADVH